MKHIRTTTLAALVLALVAWAPGSHAENAPIKAAPKPTQPTPPHGSNAGTFQVKPPSQRKGCNSIQQCDKYIAGCIALGPGFDFETTSVDMLGRPASGYCSRSF